MDTNGNIKKLLIKDLSSRLPYNVICQVEFKENGKYKSEDMLLSGIFTDEAYFTTKDGSIYSNEYKPYLFPLSSMTEEEKEEYCQLQQRVIYNSKGVVNEDVKNYINYCYKKHLDINNLIPMKLAIDATNLNIY